MLKIKKKYLGKVLKGGGVSAKLDDKLSQNQMEFCKQRFGEEYFEEVKEEKPKTTRKKKDVEDTEKPSE